MRRIVICVGFNEILSIFCVKFCGIELENKIRTYRKKIEHTRCKQQTTLESRFSVSECLKYLN